VNVLAATIAMKNVIIFGPIFWGPCVPAKSLFRTFATSFHFILLAKLNYLLSLYFRSRVPHASDFPC